MTQQSVGLNIPSIQNKRPVTFTQNATPAMQGGVEIDHEKLRQNTAETVNNNYLANRARASKDTNPFALFGLGAGIWYGIAQMMEHVNKKFGGNWETSIGGKVAKFGDRISDTFVGKKIGAVLDWFSGKFNKIEKNSQIVYTLRHHQTAPELSFAKVAGQGPLGFLGGDAETVIEEFMKPIGSNAQKLEQYGLKPNEIKSFMDSLKGKTISEQIFEIQRKELSLLGADSKVVAAASPQNITLKAMQDYASNLKIKALGFKDHIEFNTLKGKFVDHPDKVLKMFDNAASKHPNWKVSIWRNEGANTGNIILKAIKYVVSKLFGEKAGDSVVRFINKTFSHMLGREVGFSEYRNKYKMVTGNAAKSRLGNAFTKALSWVVEGGTNRFGGGKLAVALQAGIFADMLLHTYNAPKGEKGKTFIERLVNDFTYFVGMTVGIWAMHKVGGFKYAGLKSVADRQAYQKALAKFNAKADAGLFKSKKAYKMAEKALDAKLGVKNIKNPITKLLHKIGKFINIGNERKHAYKSGAKWNMNLWRKIKNGNLLGVPMRILIPLAVVTPFLVKLTTTTVHKIFGRPTHSVLDEDEESDTTKEQESKGTNSNQTQPKSQAQPLNPAQNPTNLGRQPEHKNPQDYKSDTNLIKMMAEGKKNTVNQGNAAKEPVRRYIPSPVGMVPKDPDTSAADKAMLNADMAEKYVNETLMQINN